MAETPFNPEAAGAESTADEQATAAETPVAEPSAVETPVAETPAAPTSAAEPDVELASAAQPGDGTVEPESPAPVTPEPVTPAPPAQPPLTAASQPEQAQEPAPEPGVAARFEVPALEGAVAEGEGGEWELLKAKLQQWFQGGELQRQWDRLQGPLRGLALLIGLVLLLRLYSGLLGTIDSLPLVPGLLELVGVIAFLRFCLTRLVRSQERERLVADWSRRWQEFRGRG